MNTTPGTILPNGAIVVAVRETRGRTFVLALTNGMAGHPYVTWELDPETGHTFHGDYTLTFEGAVRSFAARSGLLVEALGEGVTPEARLSAHERDVADWQDTGE